MLIIIQKDSATRISKEVADLDAARVFQGLGFAVFVTGEDGVETLLGAPGEPPIQDDAFVEIGATRFSDGKKQTAKSLDAAIAAWKAAHPE